MKFVNDKISLQNIFTAVEKSASLTENQSK